MSTYPVDYSNLLKSNDTPLEAMLKEYFKTDKLYYQESITITIDEVFIEDCKDEVGSSRSTI